MHISAGFWMVAAALNTTAVWATVPASQSRFRYFALFLILVSVLFAAAGFHWTGILAELLCVVLTNRAWQFRREWERSRPRAANAAQIPGK
ncbi:hypothetical protein [Noviherbaspirillum pedocola]|uniref:Uncharacterized protein n=1 Tax=Noviherbaspirillum pedocola TaxID=2801341 RepID=A0A934W6G4_9BURK|nr:hypothetical protein [Noviherbaspirillum pedocola]MBK4736197.1 hypothetical protein [Noviherbaspirillum pedocola]